MPRLRVAYRAALPNGTFGDHDFGHGHGHGHGHETGTGRARARARTDLPPGRRRVDRAVEHARGVTAREEIVDEPAESVGQGDREILGSGAGEPRFALQLRVQHELPAGVDDREVEDALTMWFRLLEQGSELSRDVFVERAARTCSRILSDVESLARREALQREMARHLGVSERALQPGRSPRLARSKPSSAEPATSAGHDPMRASDLDLLACVLVEPALIRETHGQPGPELATILGWIEECGSEAMSSGEALSRALFARCSEKPEDLRSFLAESLDRSLRIRDVRDIFSMLQRGRGLHFARQEADKIKVELKRALADGDRARADVLTLEYVDRLKEPEATGS